MWVEINGRINYPIKSLLVEMEENNEINMEDEHIKFCVSWFTMRVANVGTGLFVKAWNTRYIHNLVYT